jgi:hypothetical protein
VALPDDMPEVEARLGRIESRREELASVAAELTREVQAHVQGLESDRKAFREMLREANAAWTWRSAQ